MKNNTIVILFGFSGSGKSIVANILGKKLDLRVVHPSSILKDLIQGNKPDVINSTEGTGFWESAEGISIFNDRLKNETPLDLVCDQLLLQEIEKGNLVIDSWSIPWLTNKGVKIYLRASKEVRSKRVSQRSSISQALAKKTIAMKDDETQKLYKQHRGFDIKKDHHVFDLIITTTSISVDEVVQKIFHHLKRYE